LNKDERFPDTAVNDAGDVTHLAMLVKLS